MKITAKVIANLSAQQDASGEAIAQRAMMEQPYWNIERARIGKTQNVNVELIVNGESVDKKEIVADGQWKNIAFTCPD